MNARPIKPGCDPNCVPILLTTVSWTREKSLSQAEQSDLHFQKAILGAEATVPLCWAWTWEAHGAEAWHLPPASGRSQAAEKTDLETDEQRGKFERPEGK